MPYFNAAFLLRSHCRAMSASPRHSQRRPQAAGRLLCFLPAVSSEEGRPYGHRPAIGSDFGMRAFVSLWE